MESARSHNSQKNLEKLAPDQIKIVDFEAPKNLNNVEKKYWGLEMHKQRLQAEMEANKLKEHNLQKKNQYKNELEKLIHDKIQNGFQNKKDEKIQDYTVISKDVYNFNEEMQRKKEAIKKQNQLLSQTYESQIEFKQIQKQRQKEDELKQIKDMLQKSKEELERDKETKKKYIQSFQNSIKSDFYSHLEKKQFEQGKKLKEKEQDQELTQKQIIEQIEKEKSYYQKLNEREKKIQAKMGIYHQINEAQRKKQNEIDAWIKKQEIERLEKIKQEEEEHAQLRKINLQKMANANFTMMQSKHMMRQQKKDEYSLKRSNVIKEIEDLSKTENFLKDMQQKKKEEYRKQLETQMQEKKSRQVNEFYDPKNSPLVKKPTSGYLNRDKFSQAGKAILSSASISHIENPYSSLLKERNNQSTDSYHSVHSNHPKYNQHSIDSDKNMHLPLKEKYKSDAMREILSNKSTDYRSLTENFANSTTPIEITKPRAMRRSYMASYNPITGIPTGNEDWNPYLPRARQELQQEMNKRNADSMKKIKYY